MKRLYFFAIAVFVLSFFGQILIFSHYQRAFENPISLSDNWSVVTPHHQNEWNAAILNRGINISGGALTIHPRAHYRSDTLSTRSEKVSGFKIHMAEDSNTLAVMMGRSRRQIAHINQGSVQLTPILETIELHSPYTFTNNGNSLLLETPNGPIDLGYQDEGPLELSLIDDAARIASIAVFGEDGTLLFQEDYTQDKSVHLSWFPILFSVFTSLAFCAFLCRKPHMVSFARQTVWFGFMGLFFALPPDGWLALTEKLYLVNLKPSEVAKTALLLLSTPLLVSTLSLMPFLTETSKYRWTSKKNLQGLWFIYISFSIICIAHTIMVYFNKELPFDGSENWALWLIVFLLYFMTTPILFLQAKQPLRSGKLIVLDCICLLPFAVFGPGLAVLVSLIMRWSVCLSNVSQLRITTPKGLSYSVLILLFFIPVSLELSLRDSKANQSWNQENLGLKFSKDKGWLEASLAWGGDCGDSQSAVEKRIVFAGGSSTGSLNPLGQNRIQYFPELLHNSLCKNIGQSRLITQNYGGGDRNTFTINHTIGDMTSPRVPDVFVIYAGVNDLLTQRHPMTRKQRHQAQNESKISAIRQYISQSRLLSGMALAIKNTRNQNNVSEVPLADAAEFMNTIAQKTTESKLFVITEMVRDSIVNDMRSYQGMQQKLAEKYDHVTYVDLNAHLKQSEVETLLADRNHLTQEGHQVLSSVLLSKIQPIIQSNTEP